MARFRKIDVRIWSDQKFRSLTAMPPSGQGLWLYLLTSPYSTNIPGLYRAGEAAIAEDLRWPLRQLRAAFEELQTKGMARADWDAQLVWLPNSIRYNRPENPNVVKSWRATWDEIPECDLKGEAWEALRCSVESLAEGFAKAFREALGEGFGKGFGEGLPKGYAKGLPEWYAKGYAKGLPKGLPKGSAELGGAGSADPLANQEQEQEQEQEPTPSPSPPDCPDCVRGSETLNQETGRLTGPDRPFGVEVCRSAGLHARHLRHGIEEVVRVIRLKCREWMPKPDMSQYCRPRTLFGPKNFEEYRHQVERPARRFPSEAGRPPASATCDGGVCHRGRDPDTGPCRFTGCDGHHPFVCEKHRPGAVASC